MLDACSRAAPAPARSTSAMYERASSISAWTDTMGSAYVSSGRSCQHPWRDDAPPGCPARCAADLAAEAKTSACPIAVKSSGVRDLDGPLNHPIGGRPVISFGRNQETLGEGQYSQRETTWPAPSSPRQLGPERSRRATARPAALAQPDRVTTPRQTAGHQAEQFTLGHPARRVRQRLPQRRCHHDD